MTHPLVESLEYRAFAVLAWLAQRLSFRTVGRVGRALGILAFDVLGYRKKITLDNLSHAFPEKSPAELSRIARGAYRNFATTLVEMLWTGRQTAATLISICTIENPDILRRHIASKRGLIVLSGHFGNWEFFGSAFGLCIDHPTATIAQHQRNGRIDAMIQLIRTRWKNTNIPMGVATREVFRLLREGQIVAMLGDQSGPKEAVFVNFFGRPAATHRGTAAFGLKSGAPIVMTLFHREKDGRYTIICEEIDHSDLNGYTDANVLELTRRHVAVLEKYIRLYPDQWLWMHKRWKHTEHALSQSAILQES
jgi:Kdo2-lipid IVA lauroyltransferase/acyltransferase